MSIRRRMILVAGGFAVLVALAWFLVALISVTSWREQVQLRDGSVITIDRRMKYEVGGELGQGVGWHSVEEELTFRDPKTGEKVRWKGPDQVAMFLDRIDGDWWLVAFQTACHPPDRGKRLWQAFRLDESGWTALEIGSRPNIDSPNLLLDASTRDVTRLLSEVSLELKRHLNSSSRIAPLLRSIDLRTERRCYVE